MDNLEATKLALTALVKAYSNSVMMPFRRQKIRTAVIKLFAIYYNNSLLRKKKKKRSMWVRPIYRVEQRFLQGDSDNLIVMLKTNDQALFFNYLRMDIYIFDKLLAIVGSAIEKKVAIREPIPAYTRLQICLRYLASGDSMRSVGYAFRISPNTVAQIIDETCSALWKHLKDTELLIPNREKWITIAKDFENLWNFNNCIGAIDGKHIVLEAPPHSGSAYFNYKGTHSINLTGVSDAYYRFILVDVGKEGRCSDGGIFANSLIKHAIEEDSLNIPGITSVAARNLPYVLVGDEAYPLTKYLMRPYPRKLKLDLRKKVFNYRLSRARRVIESAFGILASRWRIFRRPINTDVSKAQKIVLATICLHNFIITQELKKPPQQRRYLQFSDMDDQSSCIRNVRQVSIEEERCSRNEGYLYRERFTDYFNNEGAIDWQWDKATNNEF